jgi:ParB-like chromosome segregation protein Spo0J
VADEQGQDLRTAKKLARGQGGARRKVASLAPYARNSRTHSDEQVAQIAASIKEWGFTNPVLIEPDGGIIAGHGRVMAAQRLGLDEVPCVIADDWTVAQKRAYVIADNKLALNAGWDNELLAVEFGEIAELGFDLDLTGFSDRGAGRTFWAARLCAWNRR